MRLFRLGRVARALHRFLESSFALLFLMLSFYMVVAHWFACVWYVIGMEDLKTGINFGWLSSLATITKKPFYLGIMNSFFYILIDAVNILPLGLDYSFGAI